jgi:hypothetical protein
MSHSEASHAVRLPMRPDIAKASTEALSISDEHWRQHFNTGYHNGGWQAVALRESSASHIDIMPGEFPEESYQDTALLATCPGIAGLVDLLRCSKKSVRLMRLLPGGQIREHVDGGVCLERGEARLHFPLSTDDHVFFYIEGQRVPMRVGECWYLNVDRPHRVVNRSDRARIHLVVDCAPNDWLRTAIEQGDQGVAMPDDGDPQAAFERFRRDVFENPLLRERLRGQMERSAFLNESIAAGAELGYHFSEDEVLSAMNQGRRAWIEQWIV